MLFKKIKIDSWIVVKAFCIAARREFAEIFIALGIFLVKLTLKTEKKYAVLLVSLLFYLLFNHTVGSVFVILPGKSITVNCIAPIIIMCLYFYAKSIDDVTSVSEIGYNQHL